MDLLVINPVLALVKMNSRLHHQMKKTQLLIQSESDIACCSQALDQEVLQFIVGVHLQDQLGVCLACHYLQGARSTVSFPFSLRLALYNRFKTRSWCYKKLLYHQLTSIKLIHTSSNNLVSL